MESYNPPSQCEEIILNAVQQRVFGRYEYVFWKYCEKQLAVKQNHWQKW